MIEAQPGQRVGAILIANRGEIAVRIARTCRVMGIRSIAVYSTADRDALHTQVADEAYEIGPSPATESYLNAESILAVARATGAEAIHPGYGFLAENADFARAVRAAGLIWIGPPPEVIGLLGDKIAAKRLALDAGVATVPGYSGEDQSVERLTREAESIGYPIMVKAAAGGGGRGMRAVANESDLAAALEGAQREAQAAFGDHRLFLEKLIPAPRHVEIQVLVDNHGQGVFLGERDCSLQRRHQKVIEEAPCPVLSEALRGRMGHDALRLVLAAGYENAGTVEFLLHDEQYYFLEVNTRIQVEHPVTELVTGLDLVRLQIELAAGRPLGFGQSEVRLAGHAIETRIYAEDPDTGFLPSTGTLRAFVTPEGSGIRNDVGVYQGAVVTPYYDPMLAKLLVRGETRADALQLLQSALAQYEVSGPTTNLSFLTWLAHRPEFEAGTTDIDFIDRTWRPARAEIQDVSIEALAAAALSVFTVGPGADSQPGLTRDPWQMASGWRPFGMLRRLTFMAGSEAYSLEITSADADTWAVRCGDRRLETTLVRSTPGEIALRSDGRNSTFVVTREGKRFDITGGGQRVALHLTDLDSMAQRRSGGATGDRATAPMPGTIVKVAVEAGQQVDAHQPLVVLEAMKMEHVIEAPRAGSVRAVLVAVGDLVAAGAAVVDLDEP